METTDPSIRAGPSKATTDVQWHIGAFLIVNGFFWLLDAITGGGITWAFWIILFWGFALAFHILSWFVTGRHSGDEHTSAPL